LNSRVFIETSITARPHRLDAAQIYKLADTRGGGRFENSGRSLKIHPVKNSFVSPGRFHVIGLPGQMVDRIDTRHRVPKRCARIFAG
jgi:hypothetical protein